MLTDEIIQSIKKCVLCWLATVDEEGHPNVSPKEAFMYDDDGHIVIANIASPQSVRNIENNHHVCVSFVDVFIQRGYKVKGTAAILHEGDTNYSSKLSRVKEIVGDAFPILSIIDITPKQIERIIAPSYYLYPETKEKDQIQQALRSYNVSDYFPST